MNSDSAKLGRSSAAFAMAASLTALFSTALAWAKDAYVPLNSFLNSLAWNNWITHGFADVILFFGLGVLFRKTDLTARIAPARLILILVGSVVVSGAGLLIWYATVG
jgi:hypothetical protein